MNAIQRLGPYGIAAYAVAWIIYLGYLCRILLGMRKAQAELKEVGAGAPGLTAQSNPGVQRQRA
jgi:hypothetical protein